MRGAPLKIVFGTHGSRQGVTLRIFGKHSYPRYRNFWTTKFIKPTYLRLNSRNLKRYSVEWKDMKPRLVILCGTVCTSSSALSCNKITRYGQSYRFRCADVEGKRPR